MKAMFLDTSYLIALLLEHDELHERALVWQRSAVGSFVTTEYILVELFDSMSVGRYRSRAIGAVAILRSDPSVLIKAATTSLMDDGLTFFARRSDKKWGLTDCISFVIMHREGLREALTSDHDFEQAGFRALLREEPPPNA